MKQMEYAYCVTMYIVLVKDNNFGLYCPIIQTYPYITTSSTWVNFTVLFALLLATLHAHIFSKIQVGWLRTDPTRGFFPADGL